jgi:hypothetical protein
MTERPVYDKEARRRIRRDLLAYAAEYDMGAPRLTVCIEEANGVRAGTIATSNLQHFLADKHHSMDSFVAWCENFLKKNQRASEAGLGETFRRFLAATPTDKKQAVVDESLLSAVAGSYGGGDGFKSALTIERETGAHFLRVEEVVIVPSDDPARPHRWSYEGIAVIAGGGVQAVMRNGLTRIPKYYALRLLGGSGSTTLLAFGGESFESTAPDAPLATHLSVTLIAQVMAEIPS